MAFGRGAKMDGRRPSSSLSSSFCTTTTVVVFVALCLVGAWMMTSSTVFPLEISSNKKSEVRKPAPAVNFGAAEGAASGNAGESSEKFEDTDNNDNAVQEESNNRDAPEEEKYAENTMEKTEEKTEEKEPEPPKKEETKDTFDDANGKLEGRSDDVKKVDDEEKSEEKKDDEITNEKGDDKSDGERKDDQEEKSEGDASQEEQPQIEEKVEESGEKEESSKSDEVFPDGAQSELLKESNAQNGSFPTQAAESKSEKEVQASSKSSGDETSYSWKLCNSSDSTDYIPCLDNEKAIKKLRTTKHYEHRERHCPEEPPTCLVPLPEGYKRQIEWPKSRDKVWYSNVPHTKLAEYKGHQNWVKVSGDYLLFPGGGTQFKNGALHYIDTIQQALPDIAWGKRSRVILDVGCGVASFGGYMFERDVLTMSFAPKDEHEAQVQFALERGIPAISAVMGTKRLPYPSGVFDVIHCARCRVPWHTEGGMLLLELNRLLRPGGYFVWSATPVYQKLPEDVEIWNAMSSLTKSMCWKMVSRTKDKLNQVGMAIYQKPTDNNCYEKRSENNPPLCKETDDANAAWNVPLEACMHKLPVGPTVRGSKWPESWPQRLEKTPFWIDGSQVGVYGKPANEDFEADYAHWKRVVSKSYVNGMGIDWSKVRNVMDMRAVYGGFAAALRDQKVWVMNIVPIDSPDTLPIIYERGLFGMYHDWCESFSTYPRTYNLLHADHLFSKLKKRCKLLAVFAEVDRVLRPEGKLIVRDNAETITELENMAKSLQWEVRMTYTKGNEGLLCVEKSIWRPKEVEASM
ncbi:probable methyltransferase PMT26 [Phragmites australis]|uniref:probable methyltransferase PMT26 n=1 Tax=Phragmites australis TaxID=29695 RepID=UPI002D79CB58|nr:probable methyltransferase PMT26 [Phragmites australis]